MSDEPKATNAWDVLKEIVGQKLFWYVLAGAVLVVGGIASGDQLVGWMIQIIHAARGTG